MKKCISVAMATMIILFCFSACQKKNSLTVDNAEQYLRISFYDGYLDHAHGAFGTTNDRCRANGYIEGIPGYTYNNVEVTFELSFNKRNGEAVTGQHTVTARLDVGGNAEVEYNCEVNEYACIHYSEYRIVSITGTVEPT